MKSSDTVLQHMEQPSRYLGTLFWLHGTESESELRQTYERVVNAGIGELTLESRPHWDFLGPKWWQDVKLLLGWCREDGISVYLFDEKWYPSGVAGNTIQKLDPSYQRLSIRMQSIRYRGPLSQISIMPPWTQTPRSTIIAAYAYPYESGKIDYAQAVALPLSRPDSPHMHGILHGIKWEVPPGEWIVTFIVVDRSDNYIDPLNPDAVGAFLDRVYETSKREVGAYFGNTIKGFFFDEPLYYNSEQQVPWGHRLQERFEAQCGYDMLPYLPALWLGGTCERSASFIQEYYEFLNEAYAQTYCEPLYTWCEAHDLKYIGHWYEHEAAPGHGERYMFHNRTTEGPGDFFKVSRYAHEGGIDVVCNQIWPGHRNRDYWGLPKLASSAAHIYGLTDDLALSETFGAYGWHLGLTTMKWLTDWQAVKGINHFILHAFNPKWPDLDCPPYFHDGGLNPQWSYFADYVTYVNRLQSILRGGRHVASLLLVYPGSTSYAVDCIPIEDVQQVLCEHQYDYDLIPQDVLIHEVKAMAGKLYLHNEVYQGIVLPGMPAITSALLTHLQAFASAGVPIFFSDRYPQMVLTDGGGGLEANADSDQLTVLRNRDSVQMSTYAADLPQAMTAAGIMPQVQLTGSGAAHLRILHRIKEEQAIWMLSNESVDETVEGWATLGDYPKFGRVTCYEPLTGEHWYPEVRTLPTGDTAFQLILPPYRAVLVTVMPYESSQASAPDADLHEAPLAPAAYRREAEVSQRVQVEDDTIYCQWQDSGIKGLPSWLALDPSFSGTIRYTWEATIDDAQLQQGGRHLLDLGRVEEIAEVSVNGRLVGHQIVPPYRFDLSDFLVAGTNRFEVKVTNVVSNQMSTETQFGGMGEHWQVRRQQFSIVKEGGLLGPVMLETLAKNK